MIHFGMGPDAAIETLLDLNGSILDQENGYWIKLEAWRVEASDQVLEGFFADVDRVLQEVRKP